MCRVKLTRKASAKIAGQFPKEYSSLCGAPVQETKRPLLSNPLCPYLSSPLPVAILQLSHSLGEENGGVFRGYLLHHLRCCYNSWHFLIEGFFSV